MKFVVGNRTGKLSCGSLFHFISPKNDRFSSDKHQTRLHTPKENLGSLHFTSQKIVCADAGFHAVATLLFFLLPGARSPRRKDNTVTRVSSTQSGPKPVLAGPDGPRPAPARKARLRPKTVSTFSAQVHTASGESLPGGQKGALAKLSFQGRRGGEPSRVSNLLSRLVV